MLGNFDFNAHIYKYYEFVIETLGETIIVFILINI